MRAILTTGWRESAAGALDAAALEAEVSADGRIDPERLAETLRAAPVPPTVAGLDALFRRSSAGFRPIKRMIGALAELDDTLGPITCRINALTYAFLKGAKNVDLILPEAEDEDGRRTGPFRDALPTWRGQMVTLEAFERDGEAWADDSLRATYLGLRPVMARRGARRAAEPRRPPDQRSVEPGRDQGRPGPVLRSDPAGGGAVPGARRGRAAGP